MALATSSFAYPAFIEPNGEGGFIASFRDIPEALTEGLSHNEVLDLAADALLTALEFYVESERAVPSPSVPKAGEVLVEVPPSAAAKVLLLNAMVESGVRPAELARQLGVSRQEVHRLTDLRHATKIDGIAKALRALGYRLELSLAKA